MKVTVSAAPVAAQVAVLPVFESDPAVADEVALTRFSGAEGASALLARDGQVVFLLGMGRCDAADLDALRRGAARAVRALGRFEAVAFSLPARSGAAGAAAVAEGALDGRYRRPWQKSTPPEPRLTSEFTIVTSVDGAAAAVATAVTVSECVSWARALIDAPAAEIYPDSLADAALAMGAETGLSVTVRRAPQLRDEGFGGILAVGGGSVRPPCLIEAFYPGTAGGAAVGTAGGPAVGTAVGLAGKGITFDSGGLYLKSGGRMVEMKHDMTGAASMLAVARAAAQLGLPVPVHAVAPCAENMPSGSSYKPGDVITHYGGRTSEVGDTDAEGRVVLADALAYLARQRPSCMVSSATLTYDVIKAIGDQIGGVLGTSDALVGAVMDAGSAVGEPWWQLPLWPGYRRNIDSPVADVRNDGGTFADAIHAALFLAEFTGDVPFAHLDIAGTAFREHDNDQGPAGATGFSVRTLVRFLLNGAGL